MSETKFTPGPWKAGKNPCMTTILDGHEGKAIYPKESSYHIAWANAENSNGDLDIETALANAALIAAAPELYDALFDAANRLCGEPRYRGKYACESCVVKDSCQVRKWYELLEKVRNGK